MEELKKYKKAWILWEDWVSKEDAYNLAEQHIQIDFDGEYLDIECDRPAGSHFVKLPFSMMYGVLIGFLDEHGFKIFLYPDGKNFLLHQFVIISNLDSKLLFGSDINTNKRQHAQLAAVDKAFELLEKKLEGEGSLK